MNYDGEPAWLRGDDGPAPEHLGCVRMSALLLLAMALGTVAAFILLAWASGVWAQELRPPLDSVNGVIGCPTCATAPAPAPDALVKGTGTGQGLVAYTGNTCSVAGQFAKGIDAQGALSCAAPPAGGVDTWCGSGQTCTPSAVGLPALGAGQGWLGASFTPTTLARATSAAPGDGCAQWASGTLGTTGTACGAGGGGGVTQITAGNAVAIAPVGGTGNVTVGVTAPTSTGTQKLTWNGTAFVNAADLTCNDASVTCLFAGSASEGGPATTALALNATPAVCAASAFSRGIAANGAATCSGALAAGETWVGATATPTNIATQAELDAVDAAKQATLPVLGAGQGWLGASATPTILARASGASPTDGCATWSSGILGSMGSPCGTSGGGGSVASVGLSMPGEFTVTGSPVTSAGTLTATWGSQAARSVLAGPTGATGTPAFRALGLADVGEATQTGTGNLVRASNGTLTSPVIATSTFAGLGTPSDGAMVYCSDCVGVNPCTGTGTGALAKREGGAWNCGAAQATRLASNGSNCGAGQFAQGVSALGAAEGCATPPDTWCGSGQTCTPTAVGLPALTAGQAWVGPTFTATDIATQAELDAVSGAEAPVGAGYITKTADATLTNEFALGSLATGLLKNTTTTGVPTIAVANTDYAAAVHASRHNTGGADEITGNLNATAAKATALATDPADCTADKLATGIDASGVAQCTSALTAGQAFVGATMTPTDIATQAELDAGLLGKQATLPTLSTGESWVGPSATATDIFTQAEATTALAAKVAGPSSAVDNDLAVFDLTTGKLVKDSAVKLTTGTADPSGACSPVGSLFVNTTTGVLSVCSS